MLTLCLSPACSHRLTKLVISQSGVGDAGLGAVGALTALRELDLSNNWAMTDDGMAALAGLRDLHWLSLTGSNQARSHARPPLPDVLHGVLLVVQAGPEQPDVLLLGLFV